MSLSESKPNGLAYKIEVDDGSRFVVYNASLLGNPTDHVAGKWYVWRYPLLSSAEADGPFDTPEAAELAAQSGHAGVSQLSRSAESAISTIT
jgi:hypothetical protein